MINSMTNNSIIVIPEGKICDYIDGKFRNDTPEEYVRQNLEKRLVNEHRYENERIKIEQGIKVGSNKPRVDIAIYPKGCENCNQEDIRIIIECKRENVEPSAKKDGIGQLQSYMSACLNCEWGMWTNGKHKEVFRKVKTEDGLWEFLEYIDIPSADGNIDDIDRPKRATLKRAVEDNLLFTFKTCHNHIYVNDGMQKQPAFFELLKVIFCKIEDERNIPNDLDFYTTSGERSNPDGQLTVKKRISKIFDKVKKKHNKIFELNDEIMLTSRSLAYIVAELQKYSLLDTNIDIKGKAYEEIVGANLRGDRGEFFTPRNVMQMTVAMINPKMNETVLDSSCGTGGFLVNAMNNVIKQLQGEMELKIGKPKNGWTDSEKRLFNDRVSEIASTNFYGFDINPDLVKATKMNMVMNNDGSGNILRLNTLLPPHEWTTDVKEKLTEALGLEKGIFRSKKDLGVFDIIITNPPFGSKLPIKDPHILEQFDLGHIWEQDNNGQWKKTDRLQSSVAPEQIFVERCHQLLKPGGRLAIVLPDSILGNPGLGYIRQWLIKNTFIIASIDLHVDTFQPRNGTQTSVLFTRKKNLIEIDKEEKSKQMADYNIFMAMVERVGHDKRGNPVFKRDKQGNEILVPEDRDTILIDHTVTGVRTSQTLSKTKILDDQTRFVPEVFGKWKKQEGIIW